MQQLIAQPDREKRANDGIGSFLFTTRVPSCLPGCPKWILHAPKTVGLQTRHHVSQAASSTDVPWETPVMGDTNNFRLAGDADGRKIRCLPTTLVVRKSRTCIHSRFRFLRRHAWYA
jgi:hypothetical protein